MRDIAVAVTCYNNDQEVIQFAKCLSQQSLIERIQLLVTCNAVKDYGRLCSEIKTVLPTAIVFRVNENKGYLPGCLYGVEHSGNKYEWILISNTDISFCEKDFFKKAISDKQDDVWCVGPDIKLATTGIHQNPFLESRPTKNKVNLWRMVYSNFLTFWIYFKLHNLKQKDNFNPKVKNGNVYSVHGSCFLLRKECADALIAKHHNIFMYGEELLVSEIVRDNKKMVLYDDSCHIIHNENQVTGSIGGKKKQKWFKRSINYIYKEYFS